MDEHTPETIRIDGPTDHPLVQLFGALVDEIKDLMTDAEPGTVLTVSVATKTPGQQRRKTHAAWDLSRPPK